MLYVLRFMFYSIKEVRNTWQFYRDRQPEMYDKIVAA